MGNGSNGVHLAACWSQSGQGWSPYILYTSESLLQLCWPLFNVHRFDRLPAPNSCQPYLPSFCIQMFSNSQQQGQIIGGSIQYLAVKFTLVKRVSVQWMTEHCSALQYIALHYSALMCNAVHCNAFQCIEVHCSALQCNVVHCSVLQCIAVHCSALQCIAVHCSALQCIAVHCSAL